MIGEAAGTYTPSEWPHGVRCCSCQADFQAGEAMFRVPLDNLRERVPSGVVADAKNHCGEAPLMAVVCGVCAGAAA